MHQDAKHGVERTDDVKHLGAILDNDRIGGSGNHAYKCWRKGEKNQGNKGCCNNVVDICVFHCLEDAVALVCALVLGNKRAEKWGFMSKYLPEETREIFNAVEQADPLDLLWDQIQLQYAAIMRAQRIAYVRDQEDRTVNVQGQGVHTQEAWDKQAAFMAAQSKAVLALANLIRHYESMLQERGIRVTEEQRARVEKLHAETQRLKREADTGFDDGVEVINDAPPG